MSRRERVIDIIDRTILELLDQYQNLDLSLDSDRAMLSTAIFKVFSGEGLGFVDSNTLSRGESKSINQTITGKTRKVFKDYIKNSIGDK